MQLQPNQALPEGIPLGQADGMSVGTLSMANGGFRFLLLTFQYLVGSGIFNMVINMNSFRFVYIVRQRRMRLWRKNYQRGSLAPARYAAF
jgi:hypothetical protein